MGVKSWDNYAAELAVLGEWDPGTSAGRELIAQVRELPSTANVGRQALAVLRTTWRTLPPEVRQSAMNALRNAAEQISDGMDALEQAGDVPIVGWVVAGVQAVVQIQQGFSGVAEVQRSSSNYAHGASQHATCWATTGPSRGMYEVLRCKEYAQFVKFRSGGDFDRKPCFTRKGGNRDSIFTGAPSPADDPGKCASKMRRKSDESYGPFEPNKCGRSLGISALLWPWWSAAYEPMLLPRWQGSPPGAPFQAGPSPDTNALLAEVQTGLLTDPRKNLLSTLADVQTKCDRFMAWFQDMMAGGGGVAKMRDGFVVDTAGMKKVDAKRNPDHISYPDAPAYWYEDSAGLIRTYPDQQHADPEAWGVYLPPGDPQGLGVTIAQYNAVVSVRSAFAQRRLATLRNVPLVKAAVAEYGLGGIDPGARAAAEYVNGLSSTEKVLPYPGAMSVAKKAQVMRPTGKKFAKPKRGTGGVGTTGRVLLGAGAVAGVGLIAAGASGMLKLPK